MDCTPLAFGGKLKSCDSYLRESKSDGAAISTINDERHARYWMTQPLPVLLVIRNAKGEVRAVECEEMSALWFDATCRVGGKRCRPTAFQVQIVSQAGGST